MGQVTDITGNIYSSVIIGTQVWMVENLKTTKYKDGADINGYSWYNNDEKAYKNPYGALYSWGAISSGNLCPPGWHIPSYKEFFKLSNYVSNTEEMGYAETGITLLYGGEWNAYVDDSQPYLPQGFTGSEKFGLYGSSSSWCAYPHPLIGDPCINFFVSFKYEGFYPGNIMGYWRVVKQCKVSVRCIRDDSF